MRDDDTAEGLRPLRRVVFSLGSNVDDRLEYLRLGVSALARTPQSALVGVSPVYETVAVGDPQPDFLNIVVIMDSTLPSLVLLERGQAIEAALGRPPSHEPGPRTLDVDLIAVGDRQRRSERLTLPHPRAHERAFVLFPWLDVDPDAVLPGHGFVKDLAVRVTDAGIRRRAEVIE
jgi:2-amino-4-hydroxy-6-hydroxymethyldihydropteridine diphosphokinase